MNEEDSPYKWKNIDSSSSPNNTALTHPSPSTQSYPPYIYDPSISPSLMFSHPTDNYPSNIFNFDHTQSYLGNPNPQLPPLPHKRSTVLPSQVLERGESSSHHLQSQKVITPCVSLPESSSRETHNVAQRTRRNKLKERIKTLRSLIPNCDKKDMASVLDEAIKYIQFLKIQAQAHEEAWRAAMGMSQTHMSMIPLLPPGQLNPTSYFSTTPPYYPLQRFPPQVVLPSDPMGIPVPPYDVTTNTTTTTFGV